MGRRIHKASRLIAAPADRIYAALTNPEVMATWRAPDSMRMRVDAFEPHEGGAFRLILEFQGDDHRLPGKSSAHSDIVNGHFVALEPGRRVIESVQFESEDPSFAGAMTITTELTSVQGGTLVSIRCDVVPEGISESDHVAGMESSLANLARLVEDD